MQLLKRGSMSVIPATVCKMAAGGCTTADSAWKRLSDGRGRDEASDGHETRATLRVDSTRLNLQPAQNLAEMEAYFRDYLEQLRKPLQLNRQV